MQITGSHNPHRVQRLQAMRRGRARGLRAGDPGAARPHPSAATSRAAADASRSARRSAATPTMLVERLRPAGRLKVVIDAGNGSAGPVAPELFERLGQRRGPALLRAGRPLPQPPARPHGAGEPAGPHARGARRAGADFGIGYDGDADRIGAVDGQGRILWGDQLLALFARDVLASVPGRHDHLRRQVLAGPRGGHRARTAASPIMWKTGHSLIKAKMKEDGAPLAGEMSGHMFFARRLLRLRRRASTPPAELLRDRRRVRAARSAELVDSIPHYYVDARDPARLPRRATSSRSSRRVARPLRAALPRSSTSTARASSSATAGGWCAPPTRSRCWCVRFEARTPERLDEIRAELSWSRSSAGGRAGDGAGETGARTRPRPARCRGPSSPGRRWSSPRALLGRLLVHDSPRRARSRGRIVEVEAYRGARRPGEPRVPRPHGRATRPCSAAARPRLRLLHLRHAPLPEPGHRARRVSRPPS